VAAFDKMGGKAVVLKAQVHAGGRGKGKFKDSGKDFGGVKYLTKRDDVKGVAEVMFKYPLVTKQTAADGQKVSKVLVQDAADIAKEYYLGMVLDRERGVPVMMALAEINPLVVTPKGDVIALDAKMTVDDNALFRHPDMEALRDVTEEDPAERRAAKSGLSFIKLNGTIGCLVNGAGLAMGTMDIIKYYGGEPANFLDVGGGANKEQVTEAFRILLGDKNVKAVLVNIFGGIMKCDTIAAAVLAAFDEVGFHVPLVVRLEGTNVEQGRKLLAESGRKITTAAGMAEAAQKVVAAAKA